MLGGTKEHYLNFYDDIGGYRHVWNDEVCEFM
jgi:hypothetical protein